MNVGWGRVADHPDAGYHNEANHLRKGEVEFHCLPLFSTLKLLILSALAYLTFALGAQPNEMAAPVCMVSTTAGQWAQVSEAR